MAVLNNGVTKFLKIEQPATKNQYEPDPSHHGFHSFLRPSYIPILISGADKCPHLSSLCRSSCFLVTCNQKNLGLLKTSLPARVDEDSFIWGRVEATTSADESSSLLSFYFFVVFNWASHLVKWNFQLCKTWPCHAIIPLNVFSRWRMFNQLSRACRPHRSWEDVNSAQLLLHSQEPQNHCETAQGGVLAFLWRGSGCRNARCAIPTAAGGGPGSPRVRSSLHRPSPRSLQSFHRSGRTQAAQGVRQHTVINRTLFRADAPTHLLCFHPPVFGKLVWGVIPSVFPSFQSVFKNILEEETKVVC